MCRPVSINHIKLLFKLGDILYFRLGLTGPSTLCLRPKAYVYVAAGWLGPELHVAWKSDPFIFWIVKMHLTLLPRGNVDKAFCLRIVVDSIKFSLELSCCTPAHMRRPNRGVWNTVVHVVAWNWRFLSRVFLPTHCNIFRMSVKMLKCVTACRFHKKTLVFAHLSCCDLRLILSIQICWNITGCQAVEISTMPDIKRGNMTN